MDPHLPLINFILLDKRWMELAPTWQDEVMLALEKTAKRLKEDFSEREVSIVLANNEEVQRLNKVFRNQDKPTNVLSFPSGQEEELGDIILSYEKVKEEAAHTGILPLHHMIHLIIHGFLHLLGYDHEKEEAAQEMEMMEVCILKDLNIANPYEDK
jgi:probable rRNA maturation factor